MLTTLSVSGWPFSRKPKSKASMLALVSALAADGEEEDGAAALPHANAGTPTAAIAAHANHGKYCFLNPIPSFPPPMDRYRGGRLFVRRAQVNDFCSWKRQNPVRQMTAVASIST